MNGQENQKGQMVNTLFTMLLFLVFVLCALFTVLIGGRVYENINIRSENTYEGSVALSYIANKVRQGDEAGMVRMTQLDDVPALELSEMIGDKLYVTDIYYKDGRLWELFARSGSGLGADDGFEIMECSPVAMSMEDGLLHLSTGEQGGSLWLSVRSGGSSDE